MSYQVLARKWRPATFEQMVGQSHVLHALTNALTQQRLHHAYLFTGTRGVGKTSLARLFAKGLNCEKGVTASPCGVCGSCVEIAQGRFVDLIEVDAASRTKVDDTRELLDNVQYRPTRGRFKVYLIDEVHMLSRSSFNALLKTLEEPPEHVKFLLATTDPQKLPVTVLSRCLQFNLKSLTQQEIGTQLQHILTQEQLPFEHEALTLLAKAANGSMRDALSLTDQAIAFGGGTVMLNQVQSMLGSIDEQHVLRLLEALTDADIGVLMQSCAQVLAYGADAQEVLRSLLELLHQITLTQFAPAAAQQSLYSAQIQAFAEQLAPEQVQLYYQILLTGRKDLPHAPDPKSGLEMALLRAVAFVPEKPVKRWQVEDAAKVSLPAQQPMSATPASNMPAVEQAVNQAVAEKKTLLTAERDSQALPQATMSEPMAESENATASQQALSAEDMLAVDDAIDDEAELNAALIAEQQVILSQAESQGFGASAASSTEAVSISESSLDSKTDASPDSSAESSSVSTPASNIDAEHNQAATVDTASVEQKPSPATLTEPVALSLDDIEEKTQASVNENVDAVAPDEYSAEDYGQYDYAAAPLDAYQDDYSQFMAEEQGGFSGLEESSFNRDSAQSIGHRDVVHESAVALQSQSIGESLASTTSQASTPPASTTVSLEDDDILSAVLAARDSLLSDLDALSTKEGDGKKPAAEVKLKTPSQSAHTAPVSHVTSQNTSSVDASIEPQVVSHASDNDFELPFDDDFEAELHLDSQSNVTPTQPFDPNDRPPWEEAPVATMDDANASAASANLQRETAVVPQTTVDDLGAATVAAQISPTDSEATLVGQEAVQESESAAQSPEMNTAPQPPQALTPQLTQQQIQQPTQPQDAVQSQSSETVQPTSSTALALAQSITGHPLDLHWYKLMASLEIGGRVRQLAVNSICQLQANPLPLLLKPDQKHLAAPVAIEQLEQALTAALGNPRQVEVVIGTDPARETPLEMRKRFHQELLQQARQSLMMDDNVQWLINRFGAELDQDTLLYPPELLAQRSGLIPALPEPE
ncbi:DNA polymerase III subunit gamma/tau [Shewanella sp. FJAT-51649]|uniref:DNA polymerase III subunit gamma/tau n=1 Tax=Shewanella sp. FJAT-51649 TaxID=2864210 RepID=UPI001C65CF6E|nr:DNA polymerase III subunit gamma/tau [Shewanella sp. FJAT-51649]QYJ73135.1 DNA polymerase III subunit gamma/tau [Shewanella sp. FJAT-51649]